MIGLKLISAGGSIFRRSVLLLILLSAVFSTLAAAGLKLEKIRFEGNQHFKDSRLAKLIKSKENKPFNNKLLRLDRTILTNFYQQEGFLNVWVDSKVDRNGDKINVTFSINEGRQYLLGGIKITGVSLVTPEKFRSFFDIKKGAVFRRKAIENGLNQAESFYYNRGKPYVEFNQQQSEQDSLIFITIDVKEHKTVYIREIQYRGLESVKSFIVRRELEIGVGDLYSRRKIEKSQRNIYSTGLFEYVGMQLQTMDSVESDARLIIKLQEKKSRWIGARFGVTYEQQVIYGGTFDFTLEAGHRNLFGTARTLSFNVIPSISYDFNKNNLINPRNQYSMTYVEPWIGFTRTPGVFKISYMQIRPLHTADYNYFSSTFQVSHDFNTAWQITGQLAYNNVRILESDSLDVEFYNRTKGQDFIYSITANVVRDKRDNYINPQEGSVVEPTVKFVYSNSREDKTGTYVVNRFFKYTLGWNRYQKFPLQRNWILATRLKGGSIWELGKLSQIPILERFYLGGASTVRGYQEQLLGPVRYDENGNPTAIGGKLMVLGNIELRIPLFWLFWAEVFTDMGNVWLKNTNFNFTDIKTTSGAGLAIVTPLGPIRFDYGIKHRVEKHESRGEFHISISFAF